MDVPEEPGNKNDEQVAVRHADAFGGYIIENQHEEKIMRGIRVNKRGSGATSEEQLDEWRKTERYGRTPGFKDSNVNNLVATDQTNIRRKMEDG